MYSEKILLNYLDYMEFWPQYLFNTELDNIISLKQQRQLLKT